MTETRADLLVRGTIHPIGGPRERLHAFAVAEGRVVAIDAAAESLTANEVIEVPAARAVLPGMGDLHTHLHLAGHGLRYELALDPGWSVDAILDAVATRAAATPDGEWIVGGYWGVPLMAELGTLETLARIDAATGARPLLLRDETAHNRLVNSAAMRRMGLGGDAREHAPEVVVDPVTGAPTGMLTEAASRWAEETMESTRTPIPDEERASMAAAIEALHRYGITMAQEAASSEGMLRALVELDAEGGLGAWVTASASVNDLIFGFTPIGRPLVERIRSFRAEHVRPDFAKIFLDGIPPSFTALFHDPYPHAPGHPEGYRGTTTMDADTLVDWLRTLRELGLGAKIHCTGDGSVSMVLDALDRLAAEDGRIPRVQLAHAQFIVRSDYPRLLRHGVVVDISPQLWFPSPLQAGAVSMAPANRREEMCEFRGLLDAGVPLVGASDWPVSPTPDPWAGIHGLVTRRNPDRGYPGAYHPEQAVTVREAIEMYTIAGARALGIDDRTGTIEAGKSADFVIVDRDPFAIEPLELGSTTVLETWMAGRRRFAR